MIGTASLSAAACSRITWPIRGMLDDGPPLGRREGRRLLEDVLGHGDLADVVEERRDPDPLDLGLRQVEVAGHRS